MVEELVIEEMMKSNWNGKCSVGVENMGMVTSECCWMTWQEEGT